MSVARFEVNVFPDAAYPSTPQVQAPFEPRSIVIINQDATDDVFASFDGVTDHVQLLGSDSIRFIFQRARNLFLRKGAVGTDPTNVQVIVEK